ncbi:nuclear fusion defective 4-like protein [Tanacetum coccineum]
MILMASIWIQAFTGTNFDFSAYSSELKKVLDVSQVQLNNLATASDLGKAFGWSSGLALKYLPLWLVMFIAAFMGLFGYGVQWLLIRRMVTLPYFVVFLLCLMAGCSICWFNTVCFVLCTQNFPTYRPLAISLTVSFNGVSAALYSLAAKAINSSSYTVYLLLNAFIPLFTSFAALIPILRQPVLNTLPSETAHHDRLVFIFLYILAIITGVYLLLIPSVSSHAKLFFSGATVLLFLPLGIPGMVYARSWFKISLYPKILVKGSSFLLPDGDDDDYKELDGGSNDSVTLTSDDDNGSKNGIKGFWDMVIKSDRLEMLEEEHDLQKLLCRLDFWLYYFAYFCGGTIGLVYSNNLGQIAQSLGLDSSTSTLITFYSSFSFFGRLLAAAPDFLRTKLYLARTGWLAIALVPTPLAFLVLSLTETELALRIGTSLIGLSSGFIFSAAVSITSELFGPKSVGVNHNILITNIPAGSLIYGLISALVYDNNATTFRSSLVCMGRRCYFETFVLWGGVSVLGLVSTVLLFLRTRHAYNRFECSRMSIAGQFHLSFVQRRMRIVRKMLYKLLSSHAYFPCFTFRFKVPAQWNVVYDAHNEVACLTLGSMTPELQRQFENSSPYEMLQELKSMFEKQAEVERARRVYFKKAATPQVMAIQGGRIQKANKKSQNAKGKDHPTQDDTCHHCKEVGHCKRNCSAYLAELIKKKKQVGTASSLDIFVIELFSFPTKSWVYDTSCVTHICNTKHGLRGVRKLKQVEAIGSFDLVLPNGLVICLDNCHYAPTITRGVVSVSRLVENGFIQCFTDYGISVSKNNVLYLMLLRVMVWGYEALVKRDTANKLQQRSVKCIFIGYPKETMGYYFYFPYGNKIVVARYAKFLEKNLISQEVSRRAVELEEIQDEDTSPSKNTSEIPMEVKGFKPPQEELTHVRRSIRTHRAPERLCLNVKVEEHSLGDLNEPSNYKAAMLDQESNKLFDAMNAETQSIKDNQVWRLVDLPPNSRLLAKGYTQLYRVDYEETFSPVADIRAIGILIAIATFYDYEIWQMDVKTAFLNGYLDEDIFMVSWNKRFDEEIKRFGFAQNLDEPGVYQKASGSNVTFLILYVNDIIIMGNHIPSLQSVKSYLGKCFAMKDMEKRFKMDNSKHAVGSIMYAVRCTRPDVAFAQNITSCFQQNQGKPQWTAVKTILKYLRNTKDMLLVYGRNPEAKLRVDCYCNAGFETDRDDIKSQT